MDKRSEKEPVEISEIDLLVRQSDEDFAVFDPGRIADVLVRETRIAPELAKQISFEVKDQIERCSIRSLTSSLIRELVDAKLLEYGLLGAHRAHSRLWGTNLRCRSRDSGRFLAQWNGAPRPGRNEPCSC
jgi:ribonucleoside-triphosphate reductase